MAIIKPKNIFNGFYLNAKYYFQEIQIQAILRIHILLIPC